MLLTPNERTTIVSVDFRDFVKFAERMDFVSLVALEILARFAGTLMINSNDREDLNFNLGGCLYCAKGQGSIGMKSDERVNVKINGKAEVKINIL